MATIPKLNHALERFNQGCDFYRKALTAWEDRDILAYENSLRTAATEVIGALEWTLKIYLRNVRRSSINNEDVVKLRQPNFHDLMVLMERYADPKLDSQTISSLYEYRELFRNAAEHDATVPMSQELSDAILQVRSLIVVYLSVPESRLRNISDIRFNTPPQSLKKEYFQLLQSSYNYMDLGGISPKVGSRIVKIRMEDLFIPLNVVEATSLFDESASEISAEITIPAALMVTKESVTTGEDLEGTVLASETSVKLVQRAGRSSRAGALHDLSSILASPKLVILGHPGSGKTTIGKFLAYSIAVGNFEMIGRQLKDYVPVLFRASEYALALRSNVSLSVYTYLTQLHTQKYGALINWALNQGCCIVVIDGLDEVSDPSMRVLVSRRIEQFVGEFVGNRFVISSRIVGYAQNQLPSDFVHAMVKELDEEQIIGFLEKWYKAIEDTAESQVRPEEIEHRASALWETIRSRPGISKLASNPLLLTIIALANWRGTKLPNKRVELYQIATETLVENWPLKQRGIAIDSEEILGILEPIAFEILKSDTNNLISQHELRPLFERQVCELKGATPAEARAISREMLQTIEIDTGFFLQKGHDQHGNKVYGFLHLTFAEYLTARHLSEQWSARELDLRNIVHESQWHEVTLLMAGHVGTWAVNQASLLVQEILGLGSRFEALLHRDLLLASDIILDNVRVVRSLHDKILEMLMDVVLTTPHRQLWARCAHSLVEVLLLTGSGQLPRRLWSLPTDSDDIRARKASIRREIEGNTPTNIRDVLSFFVSSNDTDWVSVPVYRILDSISERVGNIDLLVFQDHGSERYAWISPQTAAMLRRFELPYASVDTFFESKETWRRPGRRLWLLRPSELLQQPIDVLAKLIANSRATQNADVLMATLGADEARSGAVIDELMALAIEEGALQRYAQAAVLELFATPFRFGNTYVDKWRERLLAMFHSNRDQGVRSFALAALVATGIETNVQEFFERALSDPSPSVRLAALRAFEGDSFRAPYAWDFSDQFYARLSDDDNQVRYVAAKLLCYTQKFSTEDIEALLSQGFVGLGNGTLPNEDRAAALGSLLLLLNQALSDEHASTIHEYLTSIVSDASLDLQPLFYFWADSYEVIVPARRKRLLDYLEGLLQSPDPRLRTRAVSLWGFILGDEELPKIGDLLKDPSQQIAVAAMRSLNGKQLSNPDILNFVIDGLGSTEEKIAIAATSVLSMRGDDLPVEDILDKVADLLTEEPNRKDAFDVLWDLTGQTASEWWDDIPF